MVVEGRERDSPRSLGTADAASETGEAVQLTGANYQ